MCGRYEIHSALEIIAKVFGIDDITFDYRPSYNIAPGQDILLVVMNGKRRLVKSRWGFVPSWSKDLSTGYKMINAKSETLSEKAVSRQPLKSSGVLSLPTGFSFYCFDEIVYNRPAPQNRANYRIESQ